MPFVDFYNPSEPEQPETYRQRFRSRDDEIESLRKKNKCEVLIAGGGIHGAAMARLCAFNGLSTVLFERADYGAETSSRTSKMAHGGLRYLELLDFRQVLDGVKGREGLLKSAPHLVRAAEFFVPVKKSDWFMRRKLGLGLFIYDLLLRDKTRRHRWQNDPSGFIYSDGLMNDGRLVIENIVAARQEGARCLNHARVDSLNTPPGGRVRVGWTDLLSDQKYDIEAGILINCTGPWVPTLGRITPSEAAPKVRYSQGVHLVFDREWSGPSLVRPLPELGRYYFIWPYGRRTMVGTTEREMPAPVSNPMPEDREIEELLSLLARDFPESGLTPKSLTYAFAGIRTLPASNKNLPTSRLSRRPEWRYSGGMLSLYGGKFTTAEISAYEGLKKIYKLAGLHGRAVRLFGRKLPGAAGLDSVAEFKARAEERSVPPEIIARVVSLYGGRVRYLLEEERYLEILGGCVLRGEVELGAHVEQAVTIEDLIRRRLQLELDLPKAQALVGSLGPEMNDPGRTENERAYREYLNALMGQIERLR